MLSILPASTLTATCGGLLTAGSACAVPNSNVAPVIFLVCSLLIGFLWPRTPWRPPLVLALTVALGTSLLAGIFSVGRPAMMASLTLPGQPALVQVAASLVVTILSLAAIALIAASLGSWANMVVVRVTTPEMARRVQARRAALAMSAAASSAPPTSAAPAASPEDEEEPPHSAAL